MWLRGNDDSTDDGASPLDETHVSEAFKMTENVKPSSFKRKKNKEKTFIPHVSSDTSFSNFEFEAEGESLECQILSLQEQLVAVIIENQTLVEQAKTLKYSPSNDDLRIELEKEKVKNKNLLKKIKEYERERGRTHSETEISEKNKNLSSREKVRRSPSRGRFGWRRRGLEKSKSLDQSEFLSSLSAPEVDAGTTNRHPPNSLGTLKGLHVPQCEVSNQEKDSLENIKSGIWPTFRAWFLHYFFIIVEDFSEVAEVEATAAETEGEHLTVRKLKESVVRFSANMQPLNEFTTWLNSLFHWEVPLATIFALIVYLGAVLNGYFITLILVVAIFCLSRNYVRKRGWSMKFFRPMGGDRLEEIEANDSKFGDKFAVVLQVARRVQNILGAASDTAEKLKNLLLWEHEATSQLFLTLWILLLASLLLWPSQLFTLLALYLGLKFFIIDFIFFKFPRIRRKYDSTSKLWMSLPTDADLERRNSDKNTSSPTDLKTFLEVFSLPQFEIPIQGWQGGKRCTLINRDKSLTSAFRNGRLYLTNNYLCFERSKSNPEKNIKLAICDVVTIEKANTYPWIPGGGMAIEILAASGKAYFFGGIINRDEVFDAILDSCRRSSHSAIKKEKEEFDREKEKEKEIEKEKENERENGTNEKCNAPNEGEPRRHSDPQNGVSNKENGAEFKLKLMEFID